VNPAAEGGTVGEKFCRKLWLPRHFWVILHAVKHDMGQTACLPLWRKACWGFFLPKNPTASAGFDSANSGTKGQHTTSRSPKPRIPLFIYQKILVWHWPWVVCFDLPVLSLMSPPKNKALKWTWGVTQMKLTWRFLTSGMWYCSGGCIVSSVLKDRNGFMFK
jgi:hypothetical protein